MQPTVRILGTHGVPANYGGFETAAENIARYLVSNGWRVIVYCQVPGSGPLYEDTWNGIERVNIPIHIDGWLGTSKFDLLSIRHAGRSKDVCLTFGYNTAIFNSWGRIRRIPNVINMDGIEWSRSRWGKFRQSVLYVNERIACVVGNLLIADHPEIEKYLMSRVPARKLVTITYGADPVTSADENRCRNLGLDSKKYLMLIARPIPENSILEIVRGFSARDRGVELAILGKYDPTADSYHREVIAAASEHVRFLGPIYEPQAVKAIRYFSAGYLHGHTVGGTNPSLVEALAAGNPVIAHDNRYNRWVAGDSALYFDSIDSIDRSITALMSDPGLANRLGEAAFRRHLEEFTWTDAAKKYEEVLLQYVKK